MTLPTSSMPMNFWKVTRPVSLSISTTAIWTPNGNTESAGLKKRVASSPGSSPAGTLPPYARPAIWASVMFLSATPRAPNPWPVISM